MDTITEPIENQEVVDETPSNEETQETAEETPADELVSFQVPKSLAEQLNTRFKGDLTSLMSSYGEAEKKITELGQRNKALSDVLEAGNLRKPADEPKGPTDDEKLTGLYNSLSEALIKEDRAEVAKIQRNIDDMRFNMQQQHTEKKLNDYAAKQTESEFVSNYQTKFEKEFPHLAKPEYEHFLAAAQTRAAQELRSEMLSKGEDPKKVTFEMLLANTSRVGKHMEKLIEDSVNHWAAHKKGRPNAPHTERPTPSTRGSKGPTKGVETAAVKEMYDE